MNITLDHAVNPLIWQQEVQRQFERLERLELVLRAGGGYPETRDEKLRLVMHAKYRRWLDTQGG